MFGSINESGVDEISVVEETYFHSKAQSCSVFTPSNLDRGDWLVVTFWLFCSE